jgi:hypothetical protein
MHKEYAWFLCPIIALTNQLAGTWGAPFGWFSLVFIALFLWMYGKLKTWQGYLTLGVWWLVGTLPITLIGDSIPGYWFNWIWLWILGGIQGLWVILFMVGNKNWWKVFVWSLFPCLAYGVVITLSNLPITADLFPWKLCEGIMGFAVAIPFAYMIGDDQT